MNAIFRSVSTRNASEKSVHLILELFSTGNDLSFLEKFYSVTLKSPEDSKKDLFKRLWTKTYLKLAKPWLDRCEY